MSVTRKFYAALNSLLGKCCNCVEPVQVELVKSYCLPLLCYCLGALELNCSAIRDLAVAWNNAFRRIFHYNRWESVKQLQYFCGCLDFKHLYDLARYRFLSDISNRLVYLSGFFTSLEFHYHSVTMLRTFSMSCSGGALVCNLFFSLFFFVFFVSALVANKRN